MAIGKYQAYLYTHISSILFRCPTYLLMYLNVMLIGTHCYFVLKPLQLRLLMDWYGVAHANSLLILVIRVLFTIFYVPYKSPKVHSADHSMLNTNVRNTYHTW